MAKQYRVSNVRIARVGRMPMALLALLGLALGGCAVVPHDSLPAYPVAAQGGSYATTPGYPVAPNYGPQSYAPQGYETGVYYGAGPAYFPPSVYYAPPVIVTPPLVLRSAPIIAPHYAYSTPRPVAINPAPVIAPPRVVAPSHGLGQIVQTRPSFGSPAPVASSPRYQAPPSAPAQSFHHGGGGHHSGGSASVPSFRGLPSVGNSPRPSPGGSSRRLR
jgi:hypothetical protein